MTNPEQEDYEGIYGTVGGGFDDDDVFAAPPKAINFTEEWEPDTHYRLPVLEKPKLIQGLDNKRKPAVWPSGEKKMVAVTIVLFNGERRSLWAPKPSALFAGISNASQAAGSSVRGGGLLDIHYGGVDKAAKKPGQSAPHFFPDVVYFPEGQWSDDKTE